MVFFNCNACGETLKRNKVEIHYKTKCRNCEVLSCVDCSKEFWGDDYKKHMTCISEEEKYSGSNYVAKPNKGEVKQELWQKSIADAVEKHKNDFKMKDLLTRLIEHPNIPRKQKKFENFMRSSFGVRDNKCISEIWSIISASTNSSNGSSENGSTNGKHEATTEKCEPAQNDSRETDESIKKLSKREKKEQRKLLNDKKEKKDRNKHSEAVEDDTSKKMKKKRKKKNDDSEIEEENEEVESKRKRIDESEESEEEKVIKKRKIKFSWEKVIEEVLNTKEEEIPLKKLRKKAKELNNDVRRELEKHWKPRLKEHDIKYRYQASDKSEKEKFYVLSMFPYPSGSLHMGHVRVYTISDAMARFNRLRGKEVIHPMGWDAFGLPAENAAIERGEIPQDWTKKNIESMKKQLEELGCSFDWDRELATCDPNYYKWTQYIFLKMYEAGLVYRKQAEVNWDPIDQTVLADEQINEEGLSWRSGAKVEKKNLLQWYIQTTKYAKSLVDGLSEVNADMWGDIINNQKNWIGNLAYTIHLQYKVNGQVQEDRLTVKMTNPECIHGISHINLTSEHPVFQKYQDKGSDISDCITAVHPLTDSDIPVYYTEQSIQLDNTAAKQDSHVAIPSINSNDQLEAERLGLTWTDVLDKKHILVNSKEISGLQSEEARQAVLKLLQEKKMLGEVTSSRLTDWLISRQRYWGTPIPIIHCPKCQYVPVNLEDLPVELPRVQQLSNKGSSPLSQIEEWVNCQCPKCDGDAKRETDTMDTFVDSSWYYLRYLDVNNQQLPVSKHLADEYLPVDLYIGGKEHAVLHLYFARFFNHFLNDIGIVKHREPFIDLLTQGMVLGRSCVVKSTGQYIPADQIEYKGKVAVEKITGEPVELQWEKMSKSKYNGVDPQDVIEEYGVDPTRLCILSNVSPMSNRYWSEKEFKGILKWQYRIWVLIGNYMKYSKQDYTTSPSDIHKWNQELFEARNSTVHEVTFQMRQSYMINAAISRLQKFTNILKKCPPGIMRNCEEFERCLADLIIMLAPFSPMFACEYWTGVASTVNFTHNLYQWDRLVLDQTWPIVDGNYQYEMVIKKNELDQLSIKIPFGRLNDLTYEEAVTLAYSDPQFVKQYENVHIRHTSLKVVKNYKAWFTVSVDKEKKKKSLNKTDAHS